MDKLKDKKISSLLSSDKFRIILVVIGLAAIILIFLSSQFSKSETVNEISTQNISAEEYCDNLTKNTKELVDFVIGESTSQVFITLENSYEYVYLDDDKTLSKILQPKVRGVAVICPGGDDPVLKEKISSMLMTLLSVSASNVSVNNLM